MACFNIYTLSALSFLTAFHNEAYLEIIQKADMILADGSGAVWGYKQLLGKKPERIPGIDFIDELCKLCVRANQSIYCLGSRPGVVEGAVKKMQLSYPGLSVAGSHHGFWSKDQETNLIQSINESGAAVLLVGLGQPEQEMFLDRYKKKLNVTLAMGVGGSFDVLSGALQRAPKWIQALGLEWLFRGLQEPKRIVRLLALPQFVWLVWREKLRGK